MRVLVFLFTIANLAHLFICGNAAGVGRNGHADEYRPAVRGTAVGEMTLEKMRALERRAGTLDRMGLTERASNARQTLRAWEEHRVLPSRPAPEPREQDPGSAPRALRSASRGLCSSPWGPDILIYSGNYAYDISLYGNSFATDSDSSGNLFAAIGLADSTIHIFHSADLGATWTDEMTVSTAVPELQTQLDLVASDDGDSTLLNLFYLQPGSGTLVNVKIDYTAWTMLGWNTLGDTISSYWVVRDHYWSIDYFLHAVYSKYDTIYYSWSDDRGSSWYPPLRIGSNFGSPCISYGGYSGEGHLYVSALWLPGEDTTSIWVRRSTDYGSTWSMWQFLYGSGIDSNDVVDAVLASTHATDPAAQKIHALMCVDYGNSGDYNLWVRTSTDGGSVWSSRPGIAYDSTKNEHLPSLAVFPAEEGSTFFCAYYMDDAIGTGSDSLMFVFTNTDDWEAEKPGESVNDSAYAQGLRPQVAFASGGLPGIAYGGAAGRNVYYDNIWFVGKEEEELSGAVSVPVPTLLQNSPNPFRSRTSISYALPARTNTSLEVYDTSGRLVRVLFDGVQSRGTHLLVWDGLDMRGRQAGAGVYICRLTCEAGSVSRALALIR